MQHLENAFLGKRNKLRFYILVLFISLLATWTIGSIPQALAFLYYTLSLNIDSEIISRAITSRNFSDIGISLNTLFSIFCFPFVVLFFSFFLLVKWIHRKSLSEIINGRKKIRTRRIFFGAAVWAGVSFIPLLADIFFFSPEDYTLQFDVSNFVPLVLLSFLFIPFQSGIEEITCRGYLAQAVALKGGSRWMSIIIPSILFALLHAANPEVAKFGFWTMMSSYFLIACIFALASVLDDGIEIAIGAHIANNLTSLLLVTHSSSALQTYALFSLNIEEINFIKNTLLLLVMGGVFLYIMSKKYGWRFSTLNKKIEKPAIEPPISF